VVRRLEHWRLGRIPSTFLAVAVAGALIGSVGYVAGQQALSLAAKLPEYRENIREKARALRAPENGALGKAAEAIKQLESEAAPAAGASVLQTSRSWSLCAQAQASTA
jgi:predicted PurR-regulated permease PerM